MVMLSASHTAASISFVPTETTSASDRLHQHLHKDDTVVKERGLPVQTGYAVLCPAVCT